LHRALWSPFSRGRMRDYTTNWARWKRAAENASEPDRIRRFHRSLCNDGRGEEVSRSPSAAR
jgi:hypothetical protein